MDWYDRKTRQYTFRLAWLIGLLAGIYVLYSYYKKENLSDYQMQNSYTGMKRIEPVQHSETRTLVSPPLVDSMRKIAVADSSSYARAIPLSRQREIAVVKPVIAQPVKTINAEPKEVSNASALRGPAAMFSRTYTIGIGKTVPVNVVWTDDGVNTSRYKLITIKADDIADSKARFTIEDPFNVLLFSQTGYGVNDKITINDEKHNLDIRVVKVSDNAVVVNVVSNLTDALVGKLQKMQ